MGMLESYVNQINKFKLLSSEEEKELSKRIENGDHSAANELVKSNLRLVVSIAGKIVKNYKAAVMDLIQEGNMGLMAAAEKFSHSYNTKFSTYAYPWILQYMLRFVHNKTSIISIPQRKEILLRNLSKVQNSFIQKYGRYPTKQELCVLLGVDMEELNEIVAFEFSFTSLDASCGDDGDVTFGELIPDYTFNPEYKLIYEESIQRIHDLVDSLSEREKIIIRERFNFECKASVPTLREISTTLGVSAETVRQIEIRALKKIKNLAEKQNFYEEISA